MHDTLDDVGIVYLNSEPYAIAVMTTNLPTLDAGYQFIHGVSRVAYNEIARFGAWRAANELAPAPPAADTSPERDLQMWTSPNARHRAPCPSRCPRRMMRLRPSAV